MIVLIPIAQMRKAWAGLCFRMITLTLVESMVGGGWKGGWQAYESVRTWTRAGAVEWREGITEEQARFGD